MKEADPRAAEMNIILYCPQMFHPAVILTHPTNIVTLITAGITPGEAKLSHGVRVCAIVVCSRSTSPNRQARYFFEYWPGD